MDGLTLHHRIAEIASSLAKKIIFVSGGLESPKVKNFLRKNKVPCLRKPFSAEQLTASVSDILPRR